MAMTTSAAIAYAQRAHNRDLKRRQETKRVESAFVRKSAVVIAAAAFGALKRNNVKDEVAGFPWKVPLFAVATLGEFMSRSPVLAAFCGGVSDAAAAVYTDRAIVTKTLIAGEGEDVVGAGGEL